MSASHTLTLSNGAQVQCSVEYGALGMWMASEESFDLGRPLGYGKTAAAALEDLRIELESELP